MPNRYPHTHDSATHRVFHGCLIIFWREATQSFFASAKALGVPAERIICTADVVAYCADLRANVSLICDAGVYVVMGNCEEALGWCYPHCGRGLSEGSDCDRTATEWYRF